MAVIVGAVVSFVLTNNPHVVYRSRNFFGPLLVRVDPRTHVCQLWHGATMHGAQYIDPEKRDIPLSYYHRKAPIGKLLTSLYEDKSELPAPFAVLGLGAGALAAYAQKGQAAKFYEIDPDVIELATNPFFYTYIYDARKRKADVRIVSGDGRLEITKAPYNHFKAIVIDTFSSDTIPTHIITREAVQTYLNKLRKDGVLAFHISNLYYDFKPVLARLARELNLTAVTANNFNAGKFDEMNYCEWVAMSPDKAFIDKLQKDPEWKALVPSTDSRLWTDDYCNPLAIMKEPLR